MKKKSVEKCSAEIQSWWEDLRPAALPLPFPIVYEAIMFGTNYGLNPVSPGEPHLSVPEAISLGHETTRENMVIEGSIVLALAILFFCIRNHRQKFNYVPGKKLAIDPTHSERDQEFLRFLNGD